MSNEVSQTKKATFDGTRGISSKHQLNLPSIYQQYLGQKVWDFNSPKSWHVDTILKLIWSPEIQTRTYKTALFVLQQILNNQPISRARLREKAEANSFSWVTIRNVILPRLKRLGLIKESKIDQQLVPNSDFAKFFEKLADEWMRELADYGISQVTDSLVFKHISRSFGLNTAEHQKVGRYSRLSKNLSLFSII